jgi:halocyanin-like protein
MTDDERGRRKFLRGAGSVAAIGALAGCIGENFGTGGGNEETTTATTTTTAAETDRAVNVDAETETTATTTASEGSSSYLQPAPRTVDQWLLDQNPLYNGNMVVGVPFVGVGASENGTAFDPAAIKVSTGTEVTWEWSSGAKAHTVESIAQAGTEQPTFDSGEPVEGNNHTFRYTFEEAGIYRYVCGVHRQQTGRGAVVVVDEPVGIGGDANETGNGST